MIRLPGNASRTSTQAMSVPATALIAAATSEASRVKRSAATAWRLETASQNVGEAAVDRARQDRRERQQDDEAQPQQADAEAQRALREAPRARQRRRGGEGGRAHCPVVTPACSSIFAIEPSRGSKRSLLIFFQPPRSSIVNRPLGFGKRLASAVSTASLTGR